MFKTDFRRVRELFYREVGRQSFRPNLIGFIGYAFEFYYERYLKGGKNGEVRKINYFSDNKESVLSLYIVSPYRYPDLAGLELQAKPLNLGILLENLRGNLTAEFSDLDIESLNEKTRQEIQNEREGNYSQAENLTVFFSQNPKKQNRIYRAVLGKRKEIEYEKPGLLKKIASNLNNKQKDLEKKFQFLKKFRKFQLLNLELAPLTEDLLDFLSKADKIEINNTCYTKGNQNKDLIHETSTLRQYEKGKWLLDYQIKTPNFENLCAYVLPALDSLFRMVEDKFSEKAFNSIRISDPNEITFVQEK